MHPSSVNHQRFANAAESGRQVGAARVVAADPGPAVGVTRVKLCSLKERERIAMVCCVILLRPSPYLGVVEYQVQCMSCRALVGRLHYSLCTFHFRENEANQRQLFSCLGILNICLRSPAFRV